MANREMADRKANEQVFAVGQRPARLYKNVGSCGFVLQFLLVRDDLLLFFFFDMLNAGALLVKDLDLVGHGDLLIVRDVVVLALGGVVRHLVGNQ